MPRVKSARIAKKQQSKGLKRKAETKAEDLPESKRQKMSTSAVNVNQHSTLNIKLLV